ncbi:MAG: hypothetical protein JWL83_4779 [Actinomycetia bacterium]|jgi:hypothetical protein|nr:hypothetical protein [Actinomycetes bacterium]
MEMSVGERFARAVAAKDAPALLGLLAPTVDFRAMTPGRFWEANSAVELVDDVILGHWFEPSDRIEAIEGIENDVVVDRQRVGYRFRVTNDEGTFIVEQQAYLGVEDDVVSWLRVMCSGYRPVAGGPL